MEQNTAAIADAARSGDIRAFERLVKMHMKQAYFFTLGLVGSHDDALDISQNAFVKAYRGIKRLKSGESFPAWFFRILRNETVNYIRKTKKARFESFDDKLFIEACPQNNRKQLHTSRTTEKQDVTWNGCLAKLENPQAPDSERENISRTVWKAIHKLPLEMQEIIIMQHFQEMSYNEIAALLDIPRGSVASRLFHARTVLREKLDSLL